MRRPPRPIFNSTAARSKAALYGKTHGDKSMWTLSSFSQSSTSTSLVHGIILPLVMNSAALVYTLSFQTPINHPSGCIRFPSSSQKLHSLVSVNTPTKLQGETQHNPRGSQTFWVRGTPFMIDSKFIRDPSISEHNSNFRV